MCFKLTSILWDSYFISISALKAGGVMCGEAGALRIHCSYGMTGKISEHLKGPVEISLLISHCGLFLFL